MECSLWPFFVIKLAACHIFVRINLDFIACIGLFLSTGEYILREGSAI
jgi:hypothetical protein